MKKVFHILAEIFAFKRTENIRTFTVEGDVRDKNTKAILPGTTVTLLNLDGTVAGEMVVGEDGKYTFETEPNKTYRIEGYRDFYIPTIEEFTTNDEGRIEINIEMTKHILIIYLNSTEHSIKEQLNKTYIFTLN